MTQRAFTFITCAESGGLFTDFTPYVASLNDDGVVAFQAGLQSGGTGVFAGSGGRISSVATTRDGPWSAIVSHPDINGDGSVSFYADLKAGGQGVHRIENGRLIACARTDDTIGRIGPLGPTMNRAGAVAFRAELSTGVSGVFSNQGGDLRPIATTGEIFREFHGLPVISGDGTVVFRADRRDGRKGVYAGGRGPFRVIAETGDRFSDFALFPSISENGTASFAATGSGGVGVFTAKDDCITPVVGFGNGYESFRGALINDAGAVVFAATPRGGALGIFAGTDPVADKVLALGDALFGSTLAGFALNPVSVNAAGQLAIRVQLADGRQFILRADPR